MLLPNPPVVLLSQRTQYASKRIRMFNGAGCFTAEHAAELAKELSDITETARCDLNMSTERACKIMRDIQELDDAYTSQLICGHLHAKHLEYVAMALDNITPRLEQVQRLPAPRPRFYNNNGGNVITFKGGLNGQS